MKRIYLAGPMRGYPRFNFDAFDKAKEDFTRLGYDVVSPADLDRARGFDPDIHDESYFEMNDIIKMDIEALLSCDMICMLKGSDKSKGAQAELAVARWAGLSVLGYVPQPEPKQDVLEEALALTKGDRQNSYGPPDEDFARTAGMWHSLFGWDVKPVDVAMAMICLKLSRETHQAKRDNFVDIAGYARCGHICREAEEDR